MDERGLDQQDLAKAARVSKNTFQKLAMKKIIFLVRTS
jgi:hypothetical protein